MTKFSLLHGTLPLCYLERLPTLARGVWLSRMTVADGAPCDHEVTIEAFRASSGQWARWKCYPARRE